MDSEARSEKSGKVFYNFEHLAVARAPVGRRWGVIEGGGAFPDLVGPLFATLEGLAPNEPIRLGLRVEARHCNGVHKVHGGLLATFMDTALAQGLLKCADVAFNVPTISLTTDYLSAASEGEWIESRVELVHRTRRIAFMKGMVLAGERPVLRGNAIFKTTSVS